MKQRTITWKSVPTEQRLLYSQIAIQLVDDFTSLPPRYPVRAGLEFQDASAQWRQVERQPTITSSGIICFPKLGRSASFATAPVVQYRVSLQSDYYRPEYLRAIDGLEFSVHPYDDANPPAVIPMHPQNALLLPAANYPFPSHVRVLRGVVQDTMSAPVAHVEVSEGTSERVLTDARGTFSLPLRWPAFNAAITVDAVDHRTGRSDTLNINLPGDLSLGHLFTIS
ncbi:MAG: carboxypeptidase-like regulatory domain-containing protein [Pirellulaceae bacterium]